MKNIKPILTTIFGNAVVLGIVFGMVILSRLQAEAESRQGLEAEEINISKQMYDRILFPQFSCKDEYLIVVLEKIRLYCYFNHKGDNRPFLEFRYHFSPNISFKKISFELSNGTVKDLVLLLENAAPIKLKMEGSAWIFIDSESKNSVKAPEQPGAN